MFGTHRYRCELWAVTSPTGRAFAAVNDEATSENLVSREGWERICQVRGRNSSAVDEEA